MPTLDELRDAMANHPLPMNVPTGQEIIRLAKRRRKIGATVTITAAAVAAVAAVPVAQGIFGGTPPTVTAQGGSPSFQPGVASPGIVSPGPNVPTSGPQAQSLSSGGAPPDTQRLPAVAQTGPKVQIGVDNISVWMQPPATAGGVPQLCFQAPREFDGARCMDVNELRKQQKPGIGVWLADFPVTPNHRDMRFNVLRGPIASVVYTLNGVQRPVQLFNLDNNYVLAVTSDADPGERLPTHTGGDVYRMTAFDAAGNFVGLNTNVSE